MLNDSRQISETEQIVAIREFNRFYTAELGLLRRGHLDGEFSLTEARVLYEISQHPATTATLLKSRLHLDKGYMSRLLTSLTKRKLIKQEASDSDGRERVLTLTASGRAKAIRLDEQSKQQICQVLSELSPFDRETIAKSLSQVLFLLQGKKRRISRIATLDSDAQAILHEYLNSVGVVQRDSPDALRQIIQDPSAGMWLAYLGDEAVGCVMLRRLSTVPNACEVKRLYVQPRARGQGLAIALLDVLEQHAAVSGFKWIYLDSKDDLTAAINLYRKRGYKSCKPYNENPQATVFLRKRLPLKSV